MDCNLDVISDSRSEYLTDTQSLNDDSVILMKASCSSDSYQPKNNQHSNDINSENDSSLTICFSEHGINNVLDVDSVTSGIQQVSLGCKKCEGHQPIQQITEVDIGRKPYCHPPPYKEPQKHNFYKYPPPYREQKRNMSPTESLNLQNCPDIDILNKLLQSYHQPPPYKEPMTDIIQPTQGVSNPALHFTNYTKFDEESQTDARLYCEGNDAYLNAVDGYSGGGAHKLFRNISQITTRRRLQDSFSYSFSAGEPFNGESFNFSGGFTNNARQASSTNNLFSENQSEVSSYRIVHSPNNSGGEQTNMSGRPSTMWSPHRLAQSQHSYDSNGCSQLDVNEHPQYKGTVSQAVGDASMLSMLYMLQFIYKFAA